MHHDKHVRDLMSSNPRTVEPATPVVEAARAMKEEDVGSLPIVDGDRLTGILTDRDIVVRAVAAGKDLESTAAGEIASSDLVTVDPDQGVDEALRLMAQHQVRRLPVCEEDGRLVGVLAQADVARAVGDEHTGEVVEKISQP
jgi:CBS domain-containing protein